MVVHIPRWLNLAFTLLVFFGALYELMHVLVGAAASSYVPLGNPLPEQYADTARASSAFAMASALVLAVSGVSLVRETLKQLRTR